MKQVTPSISDGDPCAYSVRAEPSREMVRLYKDLFGRGPTKAKAEFADRSWRSRTQLELAVVEYIAWFNNDRLHESLGDVSPVEFESLYVDQGAQLSKR